MTIYGQTFTWMQVFLFVALIGIGASFWRAHKDHTFNFNAFDLLMENGHVSKISVAFMLVLVVTTWLMIDLQMTGKLTEGYFTIYGSMWVAPLIARVVFNKSDHTAPEK